MPGETLSFDIFANDRASAAFRRLADQASRASGDVGDLGKKLTEVGNRVATARVKLEGDKEAQHQLDTLGVKLLKLGSKTANPSISLEGVARAEAEISGLNLALDRLDRKRTGGGFLSSLFGGGGAAGGGAAGGGLLALGGAGPYALAGLAALASTLIPALLPPALGLGAGGLAAGGAFALGSKADQQLTALRTSLRTATGARRRQIQAQIAALQQSRGPELQAFGALEQVGRAALGTFASALTARGPGTGTGPHYVPGAPSFLTSLVKILEQVGRWVHSIGPMLGDLFRAAVPYLQLFVKFGERAAKIILPVITQSLKEMQPFLPLISKGLLTLVKGFAGFLNAIGPSGMQASAKIFVALTEAMAAVMVALGHTINWLTEHVPAWVHNIAAWWDRLFHWTVTTFDAIRHDIAAFFGQIITLADQWRHGWAHIWDTIYSDTIGVVIRLDKAIIGWFQRLPGQVIHALFGLGHQLYGFAHAALNEMWSGFKSIGGAIIGWIGNFAKSIWNKVKSFFGIASPSSLFYDIGKNLMLGLFHGIKDHAHHAAAAAAGAAGAVSGSAGSAQRYARSLLGAYGWAGQWGALNAVAMRESGWSLTARNPSSGAYGIAQFINGPSEYYQYGGNPNTVAGQVIGFFNYIRQRYGNPGAAWQHELNFGWYDKGGWLPPGLSLAYNATGRPEQVLSRSGGSGAGNTYHITVNAGPATPSREVGRVLVEHIKAFERGTGSRWRS